MKNNKKRNGFFLLTLALLGVALLMGCAAPVAAPVAAEPADAPAPAPQVAAPASAAPEAAAEATSAVQAAPGSTPPAPPVIDGTSSAYIAEDVAKQAALAHAGVAEADASFVRVKLDMDERIPEYEVEFYAGNKEYDYEINAINGEILSCDYDAEHYDPTPAATQQPGTAELISEARAKEIALAHAGFTENDDIRGMRVKLDKDHGRRKFEVEFRKGNTEYEYDIDAETGKILEYDVHND